MATGTILNVMLISIMFKRRVTTFSAYLVLCAISANGCELAGLEFQNKIILLYWYKNLTYATCVYFLYSKNVITEGNGLMQSNAIFVYI